MKRGFTLIEIIVSIAIIALIGVGSFVGVRYVNERIRINKLSQITDKAIMAADVWIESNKEASNQLYSERNAVFVPLTHLVNDGLLSLDNTDLTLDNIKGEYVIKALSGEGKDTSCDEIKTVTSWDKSNPLYICTHLNNDGSTSSNIAMIKQDELSNMNKASRETYYFKGQLAANYAKVSNGTTYRIVSIDNSDRITLYSLTWNDSFGDINDNLYTDKFNTPSSGAIYFITGCSQGKLLFTCGSNCISKYLRIFRETSSCENTSDQKIMVDSFTLPKNVYYLGSSGYIRHPDNVASTYSEFDTFQYSMSYSTIKLKQCMKIISGSGIEDDPYIIEPKNCS